MTWAEVFFWLGLVTIAATFGSFWAVIFFASREKGPARVDAKVDSIAKAIEDAAKEAEAKKLKPEDFIAIGAKLRNRKTTSDDAPDTKPEGAG